MALQKNIALSNGFSGSYARITDFRWSRTTREASALFGLWKDAEAADNGCTPIVPIFAKLRLNGAKFDQYLSPEALEQSNNDVVGHLYAAAKTEPVISDYNAVGEDLKPVSVFKDAVDV